MRQRLAVPRPVLADLFGVSTGTIATAERQIKPLLKRAGHRIEPAATPLTTLADITAYGSELCQRSWTVPRVVDHAAVAAFWNSVRTSAGVR
jgi:hypothetical protein